MEPIHVREHLGGNFSRNNEFIRENTTIVSCIPWMWLYEALVKAWCIKMELPTDDDTVTKYFRLNLERGIAHLGGTGFIKNIDDLALLALKGAKE